MSRLQPGLIGGLFIGVVSALPVVGAANFCCCLWVVVGGVLTAYVLQQGRPTPAESSEAAVQGLLAGVVGAAIYLVAFAALTGAIGVNMEEQVRSALDRGGDLPPEVRDMVQNLFVGNRLLILITVVTIPVYALFSMLGSLLGLAIFRKKTPPSPPAEMPPG